MLLVGIICQPHGWCIPAEWQLSRLRRTWTQCSPAFAKISQTGFAKNRRLRNNDADSCGTRRIRKQPRALAREIFSRKRDRWRIHVTYKFNIKARKATFEMRRNESRKDCGDIKQITPSRDLSSSRVLRMKLFIIDGIGSLYLYNQSNFMHCIYVFFKICN